LQCAQRGPALLAGRLRPGVDGSSPDPELSRSATVEAARRDQRQQLAAILLRVDPPRDLRLRRPLRRDSTEPAEPGRRDEPFQCVLLVVALVEDHLTAE
jgi:hypothetical protein